MNTKTDTEHLYDSDGLGAARGCFWALPMSLVVWALLFAVTWCAWGQDGEPVVRYADPAIDSPELYAEKFTSATDPALAENEVRVVVGTVPVWYADPETRELKRIEIGLTDTIDPRDGAHGVSENQNTIQYLCTESGVSEYRVGPHVLRLTLTDTAIVAESGATRRRVIAERADKLTSTDGSVRIEGVLPDTAVENQVSPGVIKESLVLYAAPSRTVSDSEDYAISYAYDTSGGEPLTAAIVDGAIVWTNADAVPVLRFEAPWVFDAAEQTIDSAYRIGDGVLSVVMSASALRDAQYPVTIDPTVTTIQTDDSADQAVFYENGVDDCRRDIYIKFTMPDLTGYTSIASAQLELYCTAIEFAGTTVNTYFDYPGGTPGWTEASSVATLNGLTFNGPTTSTQAVGTASAWHYFDIRGDSSKGVTKIYADDASPLACTALVRTNGCLDTPDTSSATLQVGDESGSDNTATFADRADATYYPRISITYSTTVASGQYPSGSAGMIMGKNVSTKGTKHWPWSRTGTVLEFVPKRSEFGTVPKDTKQTKG